MYEIVFILSTTSLYTNLSKVSTGSAKNVDFPAFRTKCNNFEGKYLSNRWQGMTIYCHATKRIVLRYKIGYYLLSLEKK